MTFWSLIESCTRLIFFFRLWFCKCISCVYNCDDLPSNNAFDTVDHSILLNKLNHRFGIRGKALTWFRYYLLNRSQFVYVENERSSSRCLKYGVPQSSVLGHMLCSMYNSLLADVIKQHITSYHFYVADKQIYLSLCQSPVESCQVMQMLEATRNPQICLFRCLATTFQNNMKSWQCLFPRANVKKLLAPS